MESDKIVIHWFRRDLRLNDNHALYQALSSGYPVQPIFIFDTSILDKIQDKHDARLVFIHRKLAEIRTKLESLGSTLETYYGDPIDIWKQIADKKNLAGVYANRDYEPYARKRDEAVYTILQKQNISFRGFKDQVIFEKGEVLKDDGKPYTVFTPYSRKWKSLLRVEHLQSFPSENLLDKMLRSKPAQMHSLKDIGFEDFDFPFPPNTIPTEIVRHYDKTRDIPSVAGTSRLSVHLRFGTVSIRELTRCAQECNEKWLNELIWRDFYQMILFHFPHSADHAFKPEYDKIVWRNDPGEFKRWCEGKTGYPIVDAGMRELNETGFMHNRVRMIVASFLVKHLLIDWRWGEHYFASKLLDYDLASNAGGWQWAAGSGCDAAPYFRVFNPALQTEKFDKDFRYIRRWVKEYGTSSYPAPLVDHKMARDRCLLVFKQALGKKPE